MNWSIIIAVSGAVISITMSLISYLMLRRSRTAWVVMDNDGPVAVFSSERKARTYCKAHERHEEDAPHHYVRAYPFQIVL